MWSDGLKYNKDGENKNKDKKDQKFLVDFEFGDQIVEMENTDVEENNIYEYSHDDSDVHEASVESF